MTLFKIEVFFGPAHQFRILTVNLPKNPKRSKNSRRLPKIYEYFFNIFKDPKVYEDSRRITGNFLKSPSFSKNSRNFPMFSRKFIKNYRKLPISHELKRA